MRLISQTCPHCGAQLNIDLDRRQAFCQYCGTRLLIDEENTININTRFIDEARLKEAEVRLKELEYEREKDSAYTREVKSWRTLVLVYIAALAIGFLIAQGRGFAYILIFGGLAVFFMKPKGRYQVRQENYSSSKSRGVAFILCFFLGGFGAHYFYVGRPWMGIFYLFTFGFGGLGWLIDIIRIPLGIFRDDCGRLLR